MNGSRGRYDGAVGDFIAWFLSAARLTERKAHSVSQPQPRRFVF